MNNRLALGSIALATPSVVERLRSSDPAVRKMSAFSARQGSGRNRLRSTTRTTKSAGTAIALAQINDATGAGIRHDHGYLDQLQGFAI
jgi:hypothetical protein